MRANAALFMFLSVDFDSRRLQPSLTPALPARVSFGWQANLRAKVVHRSAKREGGHHT
jgi:hypothetical protein